MSLYLVRSSVGTAEGVEVGCPVGNVEGSDDDIGAPGVFENLLSGGKAMREWERKRAGL